MVLAGADFGFPNGQIHANEDAPVDFYANASGYGTTTLNGHGQPIPTLQSFVGYRIALEHQIATHPETEFFNMSRQGARIMGTRDFAERIDARSDRNQ